MIEWHQTAIPNPGYANTVYTNNKWNYVVVPKCASSIIIDSMNLQPGIDKNDFDFIGTLERFNDDFKNITNIIIQKMSDRDEATEINHMYDQCINNYVEDLNKVYANDFKLFNEVQIV